MNIKDAGLIFVSELRNSTLVTLCRSRDMTKMQVLISLLLYFGIQKLHFLSF